MTGFQYPGSEVPKKKGVLLRQVKGRNFPRTASFREPLILGSLSIAFTSMLMIVKHNLSKVQIFDSRFAAISCKGFDDFKVTVY